MQTSSSSETLIFKLKNEEYLSNQNIVEVDLPSVSRYKSKHLRYLDEKFEISKRGSTFYVETMAGVVMFLTSLYILNIQPSILEMIGISERQSYVSTALISGLSTITTGYFTTLPILLSTGIGQNYFLINKIVNHYGYGWQELGSIIFVEGILYVAICFLIFRKKWSQTLPPGFRIGISFGIALFLGLIGMTSLLRSEETGMITLTNKGMSLYPKAIEVKLTYQLLLASLTLVGIISMRSRKYKNAFIVPSLVCAAVSIIIRLSTKEFHISEWYFPRLDDVAFKLRFNWKGSAAFIIPLFMIDHIFDSLCTLLTIVHFAFLDNVSFNEEAFMSLFSGSRTKTVRITMIFTGIWTSISGLFSNTQVVPFIESIVGSAAGAKTGLASVVAGLCFLISMFISPILSFFPQETRSPLMIFTTSVVFSLSEYIDFNKLIVTLPIVVATVCIPLSQSILIGSLLSYIIIILLWLISDKKKYKSISKKMIFMFILALISLGFTIFG
ncbi:xanthine/uracil permease [Anaeramoeba flamelloides]|uniref:Xanthine/uracil permease n=1 Tax=Anaeramoeba flamelloides TaxID=1746091 RepID=A0AAV7Y6W6_9EUKA|nr:xanthine/uracil permease [Anaeramoeba flamelloides]